MSDKSSEEGHRSTPVAEPVATQRSEGRPRRVRSVCPPGYILRKTIEDRLGLTKAQLRSLDQQGVLTPVLYNINNWALYHESAVEEVRQYLLANTSALSSAAPNNILKTTAAYPSEHGALVFELLEKGNSLSAIVIQSRIHPLVVQAIARDYEACTRTIFLTEEIMDQMSELLPDVELTTGAEICAALRFAVKQIACAKCQTADRAETCLACLCVTLEKKRAAAAGSPEAEPAAVGLPQEPESARR